MLNQLPTVYIDAFMAGAMYILSHPTSPFSLSLYLVTGYPLDIGIVHLIHSFLESY